MFVAGITSTARAELIMYNSNAFFKDTTTGWYWCTDVPELVNKTWDNAKTDISSLDTGCDMVWEMAPSSDVENLFSNRDISVAEMFTETGEYYSDYTTNDGVFTMGWVDSLGSMNNYTSNTLGIFYYQTVNLGHDPEYIYTLTSGSQG